MHTDHPYWLCMPWWKSKQNLNFNAGKSYGLHARLQLIEENLVHHEEEKELNINRLCLNLNQEVSNTNKNFNEEKNITKEIPQQNRLIKQWKVIQTNSKNEYIQKYFLAIEK